MAFQSRIPPSLTPVQQLEAEATERVFGGAGACAAVSDARIGLILAASLAAGHGPAGRFMLMPSFTCAGTVQAALSAGLTPMLCDIDAHSWVLSDRAVERALHRYGKQVAVVMPCATFGTCIDLDRYAALSRRYEVEVVVNAAAALGAQDADGCVFGTGSRLLCVYDMPAADRFSAAAGGLIYSADTARIETLRAMAHGGVSEDTAVLALARLPGLTHSVERRTALATRYRQALAGFGFQRALGQAQALPFMPVLLPRHLIGQRAAVVDGLASRGINIGTCFSPHIAEQPQFAGICKIGRLPVTKDVARRVLSLPLSPTMSGEAVETVCETLLDVCASLDAVHPPRAHAARGDASTMTGIPVS